jgi:hypothetical protein
LSRPPEDVWWLGRAVPPSLTTFDFGPPARFWPCSSKRGLSKLRI